MFFSILTLHNKRTIIYKVIDIFRGIAQLVEQRSPKPRAEGSNPSAPANIKTTL